MKNYAFLLILMVAVLFSSCTREDSDSVDQDTIHTRYVLEYNENSDVTYARAQFRFGGSTGTILELAEDSEISFNNEDMNWKPLFAYYELVFAGNVGTGVFGYTNDDGESFSNIAGVPEAINFPSDLTVVNINNALSLEWEGASLESGEFCLITITGEDTTGDGELFIISDEGATDIVLPADRLQEVGVGTANMIINRDQNDFSINGTDEGGVVVGRYIGDRLNNIDFIQ